MQWFPFAKSANTLAQIFCLSYFLQIHQCSLSSTWSWIASYDSCVNFMGANSHVSSLSSGGTTTTSCPSTREISSRPTCSGVNRQVKFHQAYNT